jgi:hypothetical protein
MPIIPALVGLRQKDHELEANLGYKVKPCFKKNQNKITTKTL